MGSNAYRAIRLKAVDGHLAGSWVAESLIEDPIPTVREQVPQTYAAVTRIFHPPRDNSGAVTSWKEVTTRLGRIAHRQMQWHEIISAESSSRRSSPRWISGAPALGYLEPSLISALFASLSQHTQVGERCFFGISTNRSDAHTFESRGVPILEMPHQGFVILDGPLNALISGASWGRITSSPRKLLGPSGELDYLSPNLCWPRNRTWFVNSEYEFDSTLIGGSVGLAESICRSETLESMRVKPTDLMGEDADHINRV